ncbi:hypothetical protein DPMN_086389 [Dreissena polymorpha]|uniref:Uncharacterized protein n=1 Tax=Dreissena polymorpha TaxID=45954 RepID=A0A9D4KS65_DREPO|nr:hypothetical protein DPMN_086389 [Dreissena polymorpha]
MAYEWTRDHVFQQIRIIFEIIQDIFRTNVVTTFHENWTIHVTFGVLRRKTAPSPCGHVFQQIITIFELVKDIIGAFMLTKMHEDKTINVNVEDGRSTTTTKGDPKSSL